MSDPITLIVAVVLGAFALIAGTLEFLERVGFPTPLEKRRAEKNRKIIIATLEETGILAHKSEFERLREIIYARKLAPYSYDSESFNNLIKSYTQQINQRMVGLFEQTKLNYYIDFMNTTASPSDARTLSQIMCCHILDTVADFNSQPVRFDKFAALKSGNPALALLSSIELQKPCVFVDVRGGAIISDTVDGQIDPNEEIIIIHDVVASGQIILMCANELAKRKAIVKHVFVLIERTDRKVSNSLLPSELLGKSGISLHALRQIDDSELAKMIGEKKS